MKCAGRLRTDNGTDPSRAVCDVAAQLADAGPAGASASEAADVSGVWNVVAGAGDATTTAGYRVEEKVGGGLVSSTATGRTAKVTGRVMGSPY